MARDHEYISFSTLKTDYSNTLWSIESDVLFKSSRPAHYFHNGFRSSQMHWVWRIIRIERSNRLLWNSIKKLFYSESPWLLQPCFHRSSQFHMYVWHIMRLKGCFQICLLYSVSGWLLIHWLDRLTYSTPTLSTESKIMFIDITFLLFSSHCHGEFCPEPHWNLLLHT